MHSLNSLLHRMQGGPGGSLESSRTQRIFFFRHDSQALYIRWNSFACRVSYALLLRDRSFIVAYKGQWAERERGVRLERVQVKVKIDFDEDHNGYCRNSGLQGLLKFETFPMGKMRGNRSRLHRKAVYIVVQPHHRNLQVGRIYLS